MRASYHGLGSVVSVCRFCEWGPLGLVIGCRNSERLYCNAEEADEDDDGARDDDDDDK